jgi:hypothetical protein
MKSARESSSEPSKYERLLQTYQTKMSIKQKVSL